MFVVIVGASRVGEDLARQLLIESNEVVIIEKNPEIYNQVGSRLDCKMIEGEGTNVVILRNAGIEKADFFISVTESDEINMIACNLVAAEYPEPDTIARVRNVSYSDSRMVRHRLYGIDNIINPEIEAAQAVIRSLENGVVGTVTPLEDSGLSMTSINVDAEGSLAKQTVSEIRQSMDIDFILPFIIRDSSSIIPTGDTVVNSGDILYMIATPENTENLLSLAGLKKKNPKKIAIVGGSIIGRYVADYILGRLEKQDSSTGSRSIFANWILHDREVHFIERDYKVAKELTEIYASEKVKITCLDISADEFSEGDLFKHFDLLIAATGNQELNLISSLHAKNHGMQKTMSLVHKSSYVGMAQEMGIDVTICVTDTMVNGILRILRKGNVRGIHSIAGSDLDVIEFLLDKDSPLTGKRLRDKKFPEGSLILMVKRDGENLLPNGKLELAEKDRLIAISSRDSVKKLEEAIVGT